MAVQVTRLVPSGKMAGALLVTLTAPQLSEVSGVPRLRLVALQPELAATMTFAGQVIVGGVSSRTTTNCWQLAELPLLSVAVHVTTLVPGAKLTGALLITVLTPQLSEVTGVPRATLVALQPELDPTM